MVIRTLLQQGTESLQLAGTSSPRLDAEVLLAHVLEKDRLFLLMHRDDPVAEDLCDAFFAMIDRRAAHTPVAYLTGYKEFMSLNFTVTPGVLIPRPDTETVTELVINELKDAPAPSVLELCCGSGAISVSLAHYLPTATVTAYDISPLCVDVARQNAQQNGVAGRVHIEEKDILKPFSVPAPFDCVVSNPPYIPTEVLASLESDVRDYEPHLALDGGDDGLSFYRHIAKAAAPLLASKGLLALEVGHDQAQAVADLIKNTGAYSSIVLTDDLAGIHRVVSARKNG